MTVREHDLVALTADIPEESLKQGDVGTVVFVHREGAGFEVEFATLAGETLAVVTVPANTVRPVGDKEIAHARRAAKEEGANAQVQRARSRSWHAEHSQGDHMADETLRVLTRSLDEEVDAY